MKAIILNQHGGPEVLHYTETPNPEIKSNEVLVEVKACALNRANYLASSGRLSGAATRTVLRAL